MTMDWSATMLDAAGVAPHPEYPLDGISLLPLLRDAGHRFPRPLYWRMKHRDQRALRDGDWKYLQVDGHDYLFDLSRRRTRTRQPRRARAGGWRRCARGGWRGMRRCRRFRREALVSLGYSAKDMPQR